MTDIEKVESKIGYVFNNKKLLETAITHKSHAYELNKKDMSEYNERIEFLGDAVLEHVVSTRIYSHTPIFSEGDMTKKRAQIVCEESLCSIIKEMGIGTLLRVGKCEIKSDSSRKDAMLADMFEAILGAIYLDAGFEIASNICNILIDNVYNKVLEGSSESNDYKTRLQEILQVNGNVKIEYKLVDEKGQDHNKTFYSEVYFNGKKIGEGNGKTKKESEQQAAKQATQNI